MRNQAHLVALLLAGIVGACLLPATIFADESGVDAASVVQHSSIERAKQFLTTTQKPDGFWAVHGTKKATRDKPTATANYWGTAWAVIGLLETR